MRLAPILVIEENKADRHALVKAIGNAGFSVQGLQSGIQALNRVKSESFSLVISEDRQQDISGLEIIQAVKQSTPETEVIILTGAGTVNGAVEAMQAGAADYLTKPISFDLLEAAIKSSLAKGNRPKSQSETSTASVQRLNVKQIITQDHNREPEHWPIVTHFKREFDF